MPVLSIICACCGSNVILVFDGFVFRGYLHPSDILGGIGVQNIAIFSLIRDLTLIQQLYSLSLVPIIEMLWKADGQHFFCAIIACRPFFAAFGGSYNYWDNGTVRLLIIFINDGVERDTFFIIEIYFFKNCYSVAALSFIGWLERFKKNLLFII